MKRKLALLGLLLTSLTTWSQNIIKTTTGCTNEMLDKTPGVWKDHGIKIQTKLTKPEQQEISNRLNNIHQMVFSLYSSPMGFDVLTYRGIQENDFATESMFDTTSSGELRENPVKGIKLIDYYYNAFFSEFICSAQENGYLRGPWEQGVFAYAHANSLQEILKQAADGELSRAMQIDKRPIKKMPYFISKWKGYDVYSPNGGLSSKIILLHREGVLPYIPVTRKQYLERCIAYIPTFFKTLTPDSSLLTFSEPDKKKRDALITETLTKNKDLENREIKKYQDEWGVSAKAGLLDTPAITFGTVFNLFSQDPVFTTQEKGGLLLVTENPSYFRKDLPKYVPQLIVFVFYDSKSRHLHPVEPFNLINDNFPIEKLQAMIDK